MERVTRPRAAPLQYAKIALDAEPVLQIGGREVRVVAPLRHEQRRLVTAPGQRGGGGDALRLAGLAAEPRPCHRIDDPHRPTASDIAPQGSTGTQTVVHVL